MLQARTKVMIHRTSSRRLLFLSDISIEDMNSSVLSMIDFSEVVSITVSGAVVP